MGRRRAILAVSGAILAAVAIAALGYFVFGLGQSEGQRTAAIVDQLSVTFPNPAFIADATRTLERAGYDVDYYPSSEVTVDFYRHLPEQQYDMVIVRAHSGQAFENQEPTDEFLFSSEPYSKTKYPGEQQARRLTVAYALDTDARTLEPAELEEAIERAPRYFGVASGFIESSTTGNFDDATVILMGCDVLSLEKLAGAFVNKGAEAVVGWDASVSAKHTDAATVRLLRYFVADELAINEAVARTMGELGPDPTYGSELLLYPSQ